MGGPKGRASDVFPQPWPFLANPSPAFIYSLSLRSPSPTRLPGLDHSRGSRRLSGLKSLYFWPVQWFIPLLSKSKPQPKRWAAELNLTQEHLSMSMKWIIDHALNRCVISIYAWAMLGFTQPYKASRVKPLLVLEIITTAHIVISLCFNICK